jgi:hypothetical protein
MALRLPRSLSCTILACIGLQAGALAAELGDARVASHIGQQLVADIELTALRDDTAPVQARLASADIYRGAGIAMPPVLSGLNLSVMRRGDRQFLHVTSLGPVQSDYLHLYLELADGNERAVRLATLWLTPDPNPAPLAAARAVQAAAAPEPKPLAAVVADPGAASVPKAGSKPGPGPATHVGAIPASRPTAGVARVPAPAAKVAPPSAPAPLPLGAAKPAICVRADPAALKTCVALDYKNAQLTAQIGHLEDKVKVLQIAMRAAPAPQHVVPTKAGTHAEPLGHAATRPSRAPQPETVTARAVAPVAKPKKVQVPEPGFPWWWLALGGGVLLAGVAASVAVALRRKAAREREAEARKASLPPVMSGVKDRLMPDKGAAAPAESAQE